MIVNASHHRQLVLALVFGAIGPAIADESTIDDHVHLGVASCASSVCHGKLNRQHDENVWLNEYRIWTRAGKHSRAYRLLENEKSREIARNLGLPSATTAKVCLDCHADNVPKEMRGPKFQITDGVGCEACHGGAEAWIESHAVGGATHGDNLERGMYPSESPVARAKLCLSCHMGNEQKFAGHDIMGAGHPRISFELETFTINQPAHFAVDEDYRVRKGEIPGSNLWLTGQLVSAWRFLKIVESELSSGSGMYPELSLFDCHACHHPMDDKRWTQMRAGAGIVPGSPRLQDQHLLMVHAVIPSVQPSLDKLEFGRATEAFVRAGQVDADTVRTAVQGLVAWLEQRMQTWPDRELSAESIIATRRALIQAVADGGMSDFNAAEQVYFGLESLSYSLGDRDRLADALDKIYAEVEKASDFNPSSFEATVRTLQGQF